MKGRFIAPFFMPITHSTEAFTCCPGDWQD